MRSSRRALPVLALFAALLLSACSGSDKGGGTSGSSTPADTVVSVTGITEVDRLITAVDRHDSITMAALTGYQKLACKTNIPNPGLGDPPLCRGDETDGQMVEVLPATQCLGSWVRPEQVPPAYDDALGPSPELYAVLVPRQRPGAFGSGFGVQYVIVLKTGTKANGSPVGLGLHVAGGRILWLEKQCDSIQQFVGPDQVQSYVRAPSGAATPSAARSPAASSTP